MAVASNTSADLDHTDLDHPDLDLRLDPDHTGPPSLPLIFSVSEALAHGLTRKQLRGKAFVVVGHGLRCRADATPTYADLVRAHQRACPHSVATHTTAARLWRMWLPPEWETELVHLSRSRVHGGAPTRSGVVGHERSERTGVVHRAGIAVATPVATLVALAAAGLGADDLVAAGDSLMQSADGPAAERDPGAHPRYAREVLAERLALGAGLRGGRRAREAFEHMRPGVDSRPETLVRLALVHAGFPEPAVNPRVELADGSHPRVDLVWAEPRICVQYEGDHHRTDLAQWRRDIERDRRMQAEGWLVIRVAASFFTTRGRQDFLADVASAFAQRGVPV